MSLPSRADEGKTENRPGTGLKDHHHIFLVKQFVVAIAVISIPVGYWREVGERTLGQLPVLVLQLTGLGNLELVTA